MPMSTVNSHIRLHQADTLTLQWTVYGWDKNRIRVDDVDNNLDSQYDNSTAWAKWRHTFGNSHWTDFFVFRWHLPARDRMTGKADVG